MTTFILLSVVMVVIALILLLTGLWRTPKVAPVDRSSQNIEIIKEQLSLLEESLAAGEISQQQFELTRGELEVSLLQDTDNTEQNADTNVAQIHGRWTAILLAISVPIFVVAGYFLVGTPQAIRHVSSQTQTPSPHDSGNQNVSSVEVMLTKLEQRLKLNPNDVEGWFTLGRTYMTMGKYPEAVNALEKVYQLAGEHPAVLLSYADALTMSRGGRLEGLPFELVMKALSLEPKNTTALWLAGLAYEEQGDDRQAVIHWQKIEPLLADNPSSLQKVRDLITQARRRLGDSAEHVARPAAGAVSIKVEVKLDPSLRDIVGGDDAVFIFARALQGRPMPLAVVRKKVKDLPVTVTLADSQAMTSSMKLSNFHRVMISARISRSGQAKAQKGDVQSKPRLVTLSPTSKVELTIDQIVD